MENQLIADTTVKTNRLDTKRLAHLLHAGMVAESSVPEGEIRELRNLVRIRKSLIENRLAKNRVRAVLKRTNNTYSSEVFGPTGREFLAELWPDTRHRQNGGNSDGTTAAGIQSAIRFDSLPKSLYRFVSVSR